MTQENIIVGCDIGGAHLKVARAENGRIVKAMTVATPIWLGLDRLTAVIPEVMPLFAGSGLNAFTMTGELSDIFPSREAGIAELLKVIGTHFPGRSMIYAGRSGFVTADQAIQHAADVASANWHATAALVAELVGEALFIDMGSTTTDILATRKGAVEHHGYTDAERLATGELVYTGFTRTPLMGVASNAPIRGRLTPLMNEYFASMADVQRILGALDESDDKQSTADGQAKTVDASITRLARMVGRDSANLTAAEWRDLANWFSERQLRTIHDAALLVAGKHQPGSRAPMVGAGIGRAQLKCLAERMRRPFLDFADIIPADDAVRAEASGAAPAAALALLAGAADHRPPGER
ncbi:hydantoinase/oxoprolinase family protein [Borborobacter arsenicus]|uniref:hydantoinase/oxoprolinase family protein n=1 Tax=Borborobacter arsenicus TaxID=1851146 RepID=UPI001FE15266|nr:hydantoinase/oxoprolinase family protein [Pseudaminobacter arsenicus]